MFIEEIEKQENNKRGVLLKSGTCRETLVNEFISGMTLIEVGRKYDRTAARIWQIIQDGCDENQFELYKEQHRQSRKATKLNHFMAFAAELERVPCLYEARDRFQGIQTHYHEFKKIAEQNGFIYTTKYIKRGRNRKHTQDQLLRHLKVLSSKLGYTPSCNDINREGKFTHNMYVTCFGSVQKAQELAGLSPNQKFNSIENARRTNTYITKEHCLEDLKRIRTVLGGPPSLAELKEYGKYPFSKYYSRLGGIKKIRTLPDLNLD